MKLLAVTDREHQFEEFFEVTDVELDRISPEIIDKRKDVRIDGESVREYDAAYLDIPPSNAVFGRVLIEMIQELGLETNYSATSFFIMSNKNYLYYFLHQREIPAPETVSLATEKAARNIEKELDLPVNARRLENFEETENQRLESPEQIKDFAEGSEYEEDILLFHESVEGEKYRCLIAGDQVTSLKDSSEGWSFGKDSLKYANISDEQKEVVRRTAKALGTSTAEVLLRNGKVQDINPNPDLDLYTEESGKNAYSTVAEVLKGEES